MSSRSEEALQSNCTCAVIRQVSRHVTQLYDERLAPFGLRVTQFSILSRLRRTGPRSINALAREMRVDRTTLTRNLRPLERAGLLEMAPDTGDKRSWSLTLTPAGVERVTRAREGWKKAQQCFEAAYGGERTTALRRLLQAVVETKLGVDDRKRTGAHAAARSKAG